MSHCIPLVVCVLRQSLPSPLDTRNVPIRPDLYHINRADSRRSAALFGFDTISPDDSCKSNAFEVASSTGALSVTYPNSDSTTGYPNLYYYQAYDTIYLAGSAAEVNTVYDTQASESLKIILTAVPV